MKYKSMISLLILFFLISHTNVFGAKQKQISWPCCSDTFGRDWVLKNLNK